MTSDFEQIGNFVKRGNFYLEFYNYDIKYWEKFAMILNINKIKITIVKSEQSYIANYEEKIFLPLDHV